MDKFISLVNLTQVFLLIISACLFVYTIFMGKTLGWGGIAFVFCIIIALGIVTSLALLKHFIGRWGLSYSIIIAIGIFVLSYLIGIWFVNYS